MPGSSQVSIDCVPSGSNGKGTLTARLAVESLNLTKPQ
jgi:hypothetical protein